MTTLTQSVTHVAGPYVGIDGRAVQRCMWCGAVLVDTRGQMGPVGPDGEPPTVCFWATGALVQVSGDNPQRSLDVGRFDEVGKPLPTDFCIDLVE
jgi:hypothetical protein